VISVYCFSALANDVDFVNKFYLTVAPSNINCIDSDVEIKVARVCMLLTVPSISARIVSVSLV